MMAGRLATMVLLLAVAQSSFASTLTLITPDATATKLDEIARYEVGYAYRGKAEARYPVGWAGHFDPNTGIACHPDGEQNGRNTFLLHCPWIHGTGTALQQFTFSLPKSRHIEIRGATAMRADAIGRSDGATFRVFVDGKKQLDVNRNDADWKPFSIDLTAFAGKTVEVRFETDPGTKDNPGWDFALWGDRELLIERYSPKPVKHPVPPALDLRKVAGRRESVVPPSGFAAKTSTAVEGDRAVFRYAGTDGELEYRWQLPKSADDPLFGRIDLRAQMKGDKPVEVPLAYNASVEWTAPASRIRSEWLRSPAGTATCLIDYKVGGGIATLEVTAQMIGKSLVLAVGCLRGCIGSIDTGGWLPALHRRQVTTPYYSGRVDYLSAENLFTNAFLDWTATNASSLSGTVARYEPLTNGKRNCLRERIIYTAAWHLAEALPSIPNPPSPYLKQVGEKLTLDVWGGGFDQIAGKLETLKSYGIDKCIVLIHNWQRSGYDNALPAHYPANASLGGDEAMKRLVATAKKLGYLIALHENYVDYYPNFESFDQNDISLTSEGKPEKAWLNEGTGVQSFAGKPNSIMMFARQQSTEIHRRYGTNSDYLDVHSAVPPWFHVDFRAGEEGAGMLSQVWDVHRDLWESERKTHGGPVFGEGNNHWYWSGLLDGAEAQFGQGWGYTGGLTAPLAVSFDLLRIHPLQSNQGMGYYERWSEKTGYGQVPSMALLDQYRMQEIAYGHSGFLGSTTWSNVPLAWLEHHLTTPVTERFADVSPVEISYESGGKWVDSTTAAKVGAWDRVRVRYSNGLTITANNSADDMAVDGTVLPRFGWFAKGAGVTAYTARRDGKIVDYAETATSVFANARDARDWGFGGPTDIRPEVTGFAKMGPRTFRASYLWHVNARLGKDYHCFVHFADTSDAKPEKISFQQDHELSMPTSQWSPGSTVSDGAYTITLPDGLSDGDYTWYIGLFEPDGQRVSLAGVDDGGHRIRLGVLKVRDLGKTISFGPERGIGDRAALYRRNLNELTGPIDFGKVRTDGSLLIRREGDDWVLRTWPRDRQMVVEISGNWIPMPEKITCTGGSVQSVLPESKGDRWRVPVCAASEYRWTAR